MAAFKLFYSWQSDRPSKLCRQFIAIALKAAAQSASRTLRVDIEIDSDTQGEPGTPPITETILRKIRECDAFVGDMTFVAATAEGKRLPNPNVMGEYGYALAQKGTRRILLVMNTAYGPAKDLPFDLGHLRKPLGFEVADGVTDGVRRAARTKLASELETAVCLLVEHAAIHGSNQGAEAIHAARAAISELSTSTEFGFKPAIISQPKIVLHVAPFAAFSGGELNTRAVSPLIATLRPAGLPFQTPGVDDNEWWINGQGSVIPGRPNPESTWYSRIIQPGVFEVALNLGKLIADDPRILIDGFKVEAALVEMIDKCSSAAAVLGLSGPGLVAATLIGTTDVDVVMERSGGRFRKPSVGLGQITVQNLGDKLGDHLRPVFDRLWTAAGLPSGSYSYGGEGWAGYRGEPPYAL